MIEKLGSASALGGLAARGRAAKRAAAGGILAVALAFGAILATSAPASASSQLGGVSVAEYCARNVGSGTGAPSIATNINDRWDGWRCATRWGLASVDMNKACRQQYPRSWWWQPHAFAGHTSTSMFSWRCYR